MKPLLSVSIICLLSVIFSLDRAWAQDLKNSQAVDGYKGIWFTLGQFSEYGDKYSGGLGTYTAKHIPLAIYSKKVNKTFFVYGGTTAEENRYLLCMIGSFDHTTNTLSKPVVVHDKKGVDDPHDNPTIALDDDGYLWIFVSGRNTNRPGIKYKSTKAYSIEGFTKISEETMTYPQPKYLSGQGFLNLFTKYTGVRELYFETSKDGISWSEDQKLAGMKRPGDKSSGHYQISGQHGQKVVFFFNWHPNGNVDLRTNIYYLQTVDFGKTWTTIEGKKMEVPLTEVDSPTLVKEYFSKGQNVYIKDVNFDEKGNPIALYLSGPGHEPGPKNGLRQWAVVYWNGTAWENYPITTSDHNYDTGSLFVNGNEWMVVAPTVNSPQLWGGGGEVEQWKSTDKGKTWTRSRQITTNSPRNHNYIRKVVNGQDPFYYFWADGDPSKLSPSFLYYGDSKGNVWQMPYDMSQEAEQAKLVK